MSAVAVDLDMIRVRDYLRVSFDASGRERSIEEQLADHGALIAATPRWQRVEAPPYVDAVSASRYSKKRRDGFDELVSDLASDGFGADVLLLWEASRGSRRVGEWVTLLDLCEERGVSIAVATHAGRVYDPANARDRRTLLEDAVDSEYESAKTSQRVRRAMRTNAEAGKVQGGRRPFGYQAGGRVVDEAEAAIIRDAVRRVLGGESMRSIAADLNRQGVLTSAGNAWRPGPLKAMLAGTRIAGLRSHRPGRRRRAGPDAGRVAGHHRPGHAPAGRRHARRAGTDRPARSHAVAPHGVLAVRAVRVRHGRQHLARGVRVYICRKGPGYDGCGGLTIKAEPVEAILGELVTERLADVEARRDAAAGRDDDGDELAELDRLAAMRIEIADDKAAGRISREQAAEDAAGVDRRQRQVETALAAKVRDKAPLDFVAAEGFVGRRWSDLAIEDQRVVLGALVDHVTIGRSTKPGSHHFETERVAAPGRIAWKV